MNRKPHQDQVPRAVGEGFWRADRGGIFGRIRPAATPTRRLLLGILFLLMILPAFRANSGADKPLAKMSITFESINASGIQGEFTVTKTGSERGTIQERRWRKGTNPKTDEPAFEETFKIYSIRVTSDGTELIGKAVAPLKDPIVIFTLNRPEALGSVNIEAPTITLIVKGTLLGLKDRTTIYKLTEKERADLRAFLQNINSSAIAVKP